MKKYIFLTMIIAAVLINSCSNNNSTPTGNNTTTLDIKTVTDLYADTNSTKTPTYFSFRTGTIAPASDSSTSNWDIGFYQTTVFVNCGVRGPGHGGALVLKSTDFKTLKEAPATGYKTEDSYTALAIPKGSPDGWYTYDPDRHLILPTAGVVLIIKTADGKYVKLRMMNYYKGNPPLQDLTEASPARYYNFEYVFQPDGSRNF